MQQTAKAEGELTQALGRLFALTEAYPDLKATGNVAQLQEELTSTENKIGFARQLYNDVATQYNTRQATVPDDARRRAWPRRRRPSCGRSPTTRRARGADGRSVEQQTRSVSESANLFAQQESNRRRSTWLVIGFIVFFAWVGFGGDLAFGLLTADAPPGSYHHVVPVIGIVTTLVAGGICWYSWRFGPRQVLWSTGAREIVEPATAEERQLVNVVEEMAIASGLPKPRVWIVPDDDPNAFATGRDAATASIAVTEGLLRTLSRDELQGVVAHEMAHVQNLDVRLMTLLAGMVGAIALMSDGMGRMLRGTRTGGRAEQRRRRRGKGGGNPLALVVLVLWLLTLVVAPIVSRILAMAVSRKREFLADATGAQFTRNPMALASALQKLEAASVAHAGDHPRRGAPLHRGSGAGSSPTRQGFLADTLASHPADPAADRAAQAMGYQFDQPASRIRRRQSPSLQLSGDRSDWGSSRKTSACRRVTTASRRRARRESIAVPTRSRMRSTAISGGIFSW